MKKDFIFPENTLYFDGNSLGLMPNRTQNALRKCMEVEWGKMAIQSWNSSWLPLWQRTAEKIAKLIGAKAHEIIVGDSVSVKLYQLAAASKGPILTDTLNFPSNLYILEGIAEKQKRELIFVKQDDLDALETGLKNAASNSAGLLTLSHTSYEEARRYPTEEINRFFSSIGWLNLWDLSHSIGAFPIDVKKEGIDMAVGCTYKYLNGGPGSPAFLFLDEKFHGELLNPIPGWFSHEKPFDFSTAFLPAKDATNYRIGTPPVLSMVGIEHGVDLHLEAGMKVTWNTAKAWIHKFNQLVEKHLQPLGFSLNLPKEHGSHVALRHAEAFRINRALIEPEDKKEWKMIGDHRPPDILRIAFTPLYQEFADFEKLMDRIIRIVHTKEYLRFSLTKTGVT